MRGEKFDNQGRGDLVRSWPSIHPLGRTYGLIAAFISLAILAIPNVGSTAALIACFLLLLSAAFYVFFRDPHRVVPQDERAIISPADGKVCQITHIAPPAEMQGVDPAGSQGLGPDPVTRVSIFMSIFDVHINRTPIAGVVQRIVHIQGKLWNVNLDKASEENERQHFLVQRADGLMIGFTQIAGMVARRVVPFMKAGDIVAAGQRVGLIKFGSRVDVYLPTGTSPKVTVGQKTIAGETVLAEIGESRMLEGIEL